MRFSVIDLSEGDRGPSGAIPPAAPQNLEPEIQTLLQPFQRQSATIRSIVAVGCGGMLPMGGATDALLLRFHPDGYVQPADAAEELVRAVGTSFDRNQPDALYCLAEQARKLCAPAGGEDLLLTPASLLKERLPPVADDFNFRAAAVLFPETSGQLTGDSSWRLRRSLFDRGFICVGAAALGGWKALCFLAGDAVRMLDELDVEPRGHITMNALVEGAGFANQLFRYSCVKLYALRHSLTPGVPEWRGNHFYGLRDKSGEGLSFPKLIYGGFADNDREFWDQDDPPINLDLIGYFQELPECWRKQRPLLRRLFELIPRYRSAIDAWRDAVTDGGRRPLVTVHVRRGDYRNFQQRSAPWFRMVPEDWYVEWLRAIWPTLRDPVLFVGTDEPDAVLPWFQEFRPVSATLAPMSQPLPDYIRDFEIMRRSDYLAICNSSYSHMAAVLGPDAQKCFIPSFKTQLFLPYEPWVDPAFWRRFGDAWDGRPAPDQSVLSAAAKDDRTAEVRTETLFLDVSDLVLYLLHQTTLSGIQRVQAEILRNLPASPRYTPVSYVVLSKGGELFTIEQSALLRVIENIRSNATVREDIKLELHTLLDSAVPCAVRPADTFVSIGAFWNVSGMGVLLQNLKSSGVRIGIFLHDILPIAAPEYFEAASTSLYVKAVVEALTFGDFLLTTSEYNKACLADHMASKFDLIPVHVVPLGHEQSRLSPAEPKISAVVAGILETEFVLCVGTMEIRKNPTYLFNIWKMMVRSGRPDVPTLVFVGREGWLVEDFMHQLRACNYLGGRIVVLHGVTDVELDLLYRKCLLTMFPSFVEGWGLPVGESLGHGKICICSAAGAIAEVGGKLADYIDPYNSRDGLETLVRYLDEPELRRRREGEIAAQFRPRSWQQTADAFLASIHSLAREVRPSEGIASILLPSDTFMPVSGDAPAVLMDKMDGRLSAELICISGWQRPEAAGVRAAGPSAAICFRADVPTGTKINLVLRLAATGRDFRVRIRSGSGAETEVALADGTEKVAALSCAVEPGQLITARLLSIGARLIGRESTASYWMLKGVLYFDPTRTAARRLRPSNREPRAPAQQKPEKPQATSGVGRILLHPAKPEAMERASSFGEFLHTPDCYWLSEASCDRKPPIFADDADRQAFYSGCGNRAHAPQIGSVNDGVKLIRRSDLFVSMSRFSEGSIFDRSGVVWKAFGYLQSAPAAHTPWLSNGPNGLEIEGESLAAAAYYDGSYLVFYNGNLHNYYHWLVEGLLGLDVSARAVGYASNFKIALPKTMDINALIEHRESLQAIGLGGGEIVEVASGLFKVREAIWVDSDLVQSMPAVHLKDFQQRIAALYAGVRPLRKRRLLVARRGPTRTIHNLAEVQAYLSGHGFETVYLEGMSVLEQVLLFQSAEFVVSPHGAGLSNLMFCEPGTKVIELMPAVELRTFFWLISEKLGLVHAMQFCTPAGAQEFQSPIYVDISKLHALFGKIAG